VLEGRETTEAVRSAHCSATVLPQHSHASVAYHSLIFNVSFAVVRADMVCSQHCTTSYYQVVDCWVCCPIIAPMCQIKSHLKRSRRSQRRRCNVKDRENRERKARQQAKRNVSIHEAHGKSRGCTKASTHSPSCWSNSVSRNNIPLFYSYTSETCKIRDGWCAVSERLPLRPTCKVTGIDVGGR